MASNDRLVETQAGTGGEGTTPPSPPRRRGIHWRRALLPAVVLLVASSSCSRWPGTLSGKLSSVIENDQAAFLPDSAESTKSLELETRFAGAQDIPALIVWERTGRADRRRPRRGRARRWSRIDDVEGIAGPASAPIPSEDGEAVQVVVPLPGDNSAFETLPGIVEDVTEAAQVDGLPSLRDRARAASSPTSPRRSRASTASCSSRRSASSW